MELSPLVKKDFKDLCGLMKATTPELEFVRPPILEMQTFSDVDHDSNYLIKATEKKKLVAACLGVARTLDGVKNGFVKYFGVHPKFRRKGVGQMIFSELERRFQKRDVREVRVGGCPAPYLQGGVASTDTAAVCFLLNRSYARQGDCVDMVAELGRWKPKVLDQDKALIKEFLVRKAAGKDEGILLELAREHFPSWAFEIRASLKRGVLWVAEKEGHAVAFSAGNGMSPGWFGPMGTLPNFRGKGLARLLFNKTLLSMKMSGSRKVRIPWVGPISFYAKHSGATLGPVFWCFSKKV